MKHNHVISGWVFKKRNKKDWEIVPIKTFCIPLPALTHYLCLHKISTSSSNGAELY